MPDKIPTAKSFLKDKGINSIEPIYFDFGDTQITLENLLQEYTLSVLEAHKEAIKEGVEIYIHPDACSPGDAEIDKESIDTASKNFIDNLKH